MNYKLVLFIVFFLSSCNYKAGYPDTTIEQKLIFESIQKTKSLLLKDNGKLWKTSIWDENLLILTDSIVYGLKEHVGSKKINASLFASASKDEELSQTNTTQEFKGSKYATVLFDALDGSSTTIIHELFHLAHLKNQKLTADPIGYLDNTDSREWLRLEFQALKNALDSAQKDNRKEVLTFLNDACLFRKQQQIKYVQFLKKELELENVEGLANYSGFKLSSHTNKYRLAIDEIQFREKAETYSRPFPYATGPAYGLLFDYLKIDWRNGLDIIYNFLDIYESQILKHPLELNKNRVMLSRKRNNYDIIHREEKTKAEKSQSQISFYKKLFLEQPTLKVSLRDNDYAFSFDMNGTLALEDIGLIYSMVTGQDLSGNNFGDFTIDPEKASLGVTGILELEGTDDFLFPAPTKIKGSTIKGDFYEIKLNDSWIVEKVMGTKNYIILKK